MTALLWKEWRENLYKVGVGVALSGLLLLLRQWGTFNQAFTGMIQVWASAIGGLTAGVLAMDAVAGERSRGTLDFLLARPSTPASILLPKFLAGAGALLAVVAAYWLTVYASPPAGDEAGRWASWALADVPWSSMVLAWFVPLVAVYSLVFVASTATENPAEAAAAGGILTLGTLFGYVVLSQLVPQVGAWQLVETALDMAMATTGSAVRTATDPSVVLLRSALAAGVVALTLAASVALLSRHRQFSLQRRTIVVAGFGLVALGLTIPPLLPSPRTSLSPVVQVPLDAPGKGLLSLPWSPAGGFVAVHAEGVQVFPPGFMATVASIAAAAGTGGTLMAPGEIGARVGLGVGGVAGGAVAAGRVWLAREPTEAAPQAEVIAVAVDDPARPRVLKRAPIGEPGLVRGVAGFEAVGDDLVVFAADAGGRPVVLLLEASADGAVRERGRLAVPMADDAAAHLRSMAPSQRHLYGVAVNGGRAYLGLAAELVAVDLGGPDRPHETSRLRLERPGRLYGSGYRHVAVLDRHLYVARHWPTELVEMDLTDPANPRELDTGYLGSPLMGARALGPLLYRDQYARGAELYDPSDLAARPVPYLPGGALAGVPLLLDGRLWATMGDRLVVFDLPPRLGAVVAGGR